MYDIKITDEAEYDLFEIKGYISLDNNLFGYKVINSILKTISNIGLFPEIGSVKGKYRVFIESKYKYNIKYKILNKTVYILTIYKYKNK